MNELLTALANKLSELEDNDGEVVLIYREYDIKESLFFVSGSINYSYETSTDDYLTPSISRRNFVFADLDITVFIDENDEDGRELTENELIELYNSL